VVGVDDYRWAQNNPRLDAYCVTAVAGGTRETVLAGFGAELATETPATFEEAFNGFPSPTYVLLDVVSGGVLAVENNGWRGVEDGVASELSRGAAVAAFYRNVNAVMTFVHVVDGIVLATFDPLLDDVPSELATEGEGLPFGVDNAQASAFALLERLTGIRLEAEWLGAAHSRFDIRPPV
jgi:Family of unknown function (DUF6461)